MEAVLSFIRYYKPTDLVQLGDFCDWDSLTTYEVRREQDIITISKEIEESNKLLDTIEAALPDGCSKVMIGGNHEARYERARVNRGHEVVIRQLKNFSSWFNEYRLNERGWSHVEYGECVSIGLAVFTHGWSSGPGAALKHLNMFHKNIFFGHTHTYQVAIGSGLDGLPVISATIGTLSRFDLSYLVGKPPVNWMNMFMYLDMYDDGTFTPHFVPIIHGRFHELGRDFNANIS